MKLTNNTNKGGGDRTLSTQLYSLKLSLFFSVLSSLCNSIEFPSQPPNVPRKSLPNTLNYT
jgi:hypothetical protein